MTLPTDVITKEIIQQYEEIRANGACNMLDRRCVQEVADLAGFYGLASLTKDEYILIPKHYSELMEHHGIQRLGGKDDSGANININQGGPNCPI